MQSLDSLENNVERPFEQRPDQNSGRLFFCGTCEFLAHAHAVASKGLKTSMNPDVYAKRLAQVPVPGRGVHRGRKFQLRRGASWPGLPKPSTLSPQP